MNDVVLINSEEVYYLHLVIRLNVCDPLRKLVGLQGGRGLLGLLCSRLIILRVKTPEMFKMVFPTMYIQSYMGVATPVTDIEPQTHN